MWDACQREILAALGCTPWTLAPPEVPEDPLLHALLSAAGRDRDAGDVAQLLRVLPPTSSLRGDPRAKRALWPQLRRLRQRVQ